MRVLPPRPTQREIAREIDAACARGGVCWTQEWADGDFALIDNRALAHLPAPGTQAPPRADGAGLRVFHRSTVVDRAAAAVPRSARRGAPSRVVTGTPAPGAAPLARARGALADSETLARVLRQVVRA